MESAPLRGREHVFTSLDALRLLGECGVEGAKKNLCRQQKLFSCIE
jgi:hypothetical protein